MRINSLKIAIGMLMVASLACNYLLGRMPGQQAEPTATADSEVSAVSQGPTPAPPEADYYDINGEPVEYDPPPQEMVDLMLAKVESGQVEMDQGVLELMRVLAGEGLTPNYSQDVEGGTQFRSGWGLSLLAHQVYQQTEDAELRQELARLHRRLAPPHQALMQYAAPAEDFQSLTPEGQPGLSKQIDCSEIWATGFPESMGPAPTCLLFNGFQAGGFNYFVYHPTDMQDDPAKMAYVEAAFQALQDSRTEYAKFFDVRSIDLVFSPIQATDIGGPVGGTAFVPGLDVDEMGGAPCPITIVQGAYSYSTDKFKQIVAHEVFHCVNLWRKGFNGYNDTNWYDEGLAEYFSNVVYPSVNNEHDSVHEFHGASITQSIFEMSYENVVFFQYLANQFGHEWLINLYDSMPSENTAEMLAVMSSTPDMDAIFHEFARAYIDGKIHDTNGVAYPGTALFLPEDSYIMPSDGSLTQEAKSFHIDRATVLYEPMQQITQEINDEDDAGEHSARSTGNQAWGTMPDEVATCDDPLSFVQVLTSTEAGPVGAKTASLEVSVMEADENECDQCLVGVWRNDFATSDYWNHVMDASASRDTFLDQVSGTSRFRFFEDGTYQFSTEGWETIWVNASVEDVVTQTITRVQVSESGSYFTHGGEQLQLVEVENEYYSELFSIISGPLGTFTSDTLVDTEGGDGTALTDEGAAYQCSEDTLTIEGADPGWGWSGVTVYQRVDEDPTAPAGSGSGQ